MTIYRHVVVALLGNVQDDSDAGMCCVRAIVVRDIRDLEEAVRLYRVNIDVFAMTSLLSTT